MGKFLEKERVLRKEMKSTIPFEIGDKTACMVSYGLVLQ
ncbi:hypothetical protein LEP1GSC062_1450 [Leptospira alexanderi serovar Manhao 3 str. L 60]|uniref:Uncharacterized protein n=1 Tax=Leptospira alexanderi serovar Manhao 3 str. L 60 TaxID=1049759 RepID=V6HWC4_9LEPT|nr:hypothetical protein LEP1GSC062_1450 [Leptospira alexanderi serovar Manhao 3 str. L 60]